MRITAYLDIQLSLPPSPSTFTPHHEEATTTDEESKRSDSSDPRMEMLLVTRKACRHKMSLMPLLIMLVLLTWMIQILSLIKQHSSIYHSSFNFFCI